MKHLIFCLLIVLIFSANLFSQPTPMPTPPSGGTNSVYLYNGQYIFSYYEGTQEKLRYTYFLSNGGFFNGLSATVNNSYTFYPSVGGGIAVKIDNQTYHSYDNNVAFSLLDTNLVNNILTAKWDMSIYIRGGRIYHFIFSYTISIIGRSLIIHVQQDEEQNVNLVSEVDLDRCDYVYNPVIVGIPYLTLFNILYCDNTQSNNKVFCSMFFDWTATNASKFQPRNSQFNGTSVCFSQIARYEEKTDRLRNPLNETIYLTISPNLEETFPNIPNDASPYRSESINRIVFDYWECLPDSCPDLWINTTPNRLDALSANGITNVWMILHEWQKQNYDCGYPTDIMPAYTDWGGPIALNNVRDKAVNDLGYLFALHENYYAIQEGVPFYDPSVLSDPPYGEPLIPLTNWCTGHNLYPLKPSQYLYFSNMMSSQIKNEHKPNSGFLDVHTAGDPSDYVDYDAAEEGAGKFTYAFSCNKSIGQNLQNYYEGPVSGEGRCHFIYSGIYDDFCASICTGQSIAFQWKYSELNEYFGGYYKPLIVNFDLLKMREKTFVHGVGYYERFFYYCPDEPFNMTCYGQYQTGNNDVLIYTATELAYAHGGFFTKSNYVNFDYLQQADVQFNNVFPMQGLYANAGIISILYNDGGNLISASDFIKNHPNDFNCFINTDDCSNENFLGQVRIEYNNGTIVYVNRHPTRSWNNISEGGGWYNYNSYVNGSSTVLLGTGIFGTNASFNLPPEIGWVCYSPVNPSKNSVKKSQDSYSPYHFKLSQNYPNPFNPETVIKYEIAKESNVTIKIYNILGQLVRTMVNNELKKPGIYNLNFDGSNLASGLYFYKIEAGTFIETKKMLLIK